MKESYKAHVAAQLKHDFPDFKQSYMNSVTERHNSHLLPIVKEVEAVRADVFGEKRTWSLRPLNEDCSETEVSELSLIHI